mmetsp:Transcript_873/g.2088  ORF Transcript_873/g.2088 Transcript_873/m.2088 type:complete len:251 (-) Transcript_873:36-788(-)
MRVDDLRGRGDALVVDRAGRGAHAGGLAAARCLTFVLHAIAIGSHVAWCVLRIETLPSRAVDANFVVLVGVPSTDWHGRGWGGCRAWGGGCDRCHRSDRDGGRAVEAGVTVSVGVADASGERVRTGRVADEVVGIVTAAAVVGLAIVGPAFCIRLFVQGGLLDVRVLEVHAFHIVNGAAPRSVGIHVRVVPASAATGLGAEPPDLDPFVIGGVLVHLVESAAQLVLGGRGRDEELRACEDRKHQQELDAE